MTDRIKLEGEVRSDFGKGAARRLRMENKIPASVYAHGNDPLFLQLPMKETTNAMRRVNAIYELAFGGEVHTAVVKDIQRNPVKRIIEHIDFYEVKKGDKIEIEVPVFIEGETKGNGVAFVDVQNLRVKADVSNLPESFVLSVEGMREGESILAKDIELPKGAELMDIDPDESVVSVKFLQDEAEAAPVAAAAPAEGAADAKDEAKADEK